MRWAIWLLGASTGLGFAPHGPGRVGSRQIPARPIGITGSKTGDAADDGIAGTGSSAFAQASAPAGSEKADEKMQNIKAWLTENKDAPAGTTAAVLVWRLSFGTSFNEDRSAEMAERFTSLAALFGANEALTMVKNSDGLTLNTETERVREYFDSWSSRVGDRDKTIELLCLNPNLMAGDIRDIETQPEFLVKQNLRFAKAIDFTRNFFA